MHMSSTRTVPEFKGTSAKKCEEFVRAINQYAFQEGRQRDDAWIAELAGARLLGRALRWHTELDESTQSSWKLLKKALFKCWPLKSESKPQPESRYAKKVKDVTIPTAAAAPPSPTGDQTSANQSARRPNQDLYEEYGDNSASRLRSIPPAYIAPPRETDKYMVPHPTQMIEDRPDKIPQAKKARQGPTEEEEMRPQIASEWASLLREENYQLAKEELLVRPWLESQSEAEVAHRTKEAQQQTEQDQKDRVIFRRFLNQKSRKGNERH